jgi:hypothetical protein
MTFLDEIIQQHKELESPQSFWKWSAIAAISAVVKDNIWLDRQIMNLYPNIYVMLHAESGLKKGPPIAMARRLVSAAVGDAKIISGRSSIQGILKEMGTAKTIEKGGGRVDAKAAAFICSSELSSSIVDDPVATKILTDLYDRSYNVGEWKSLLKMESFNLKDPTITMLTATNEAMAEGFFTKSAIQGGYFARTFIIYESKGHVSNSLTYPLENPPNYTKSAEYLKEIAKLRGPFNKWASIEKTDEFKYKRVKNGRDIYFNEVGTVYDDWYETFKEQLTSQEIKDETGTLNRFGDSVLKVAMLFSIARKPELIVTVDAMHEAITECEKLIGNARRTTIGKQGMSNTALLKTNIIMELLNRETHSVSRTVLTKKLWMHYGSIEEFDNLMLSFDHAGMIKTENVGNQIVYRMPSEQVEELKRFMAGKNK